MVGLFLSLSLSPLSRFFLSSSLPLVFAFCSRDPSAVRSAPPQRGPYSTVLNSSRGQIGAMLVDASKARAQYLSPFRGRGEQREPPDQENVFPFARRFEHSRHRNKPSSSQLTGRATARLTAVLKDVSTLVGRRDCGGREGLSEREGNDLSEFLCGYGSALPASQAKEKKRKRTHRNGLGPVRRGPLCRYSFHRGINLNNTEMLAGEREGWNGWKCLRGGRSRCVKRNQKTQRKTFFSWFFFLCSSLKQRDTLPQRSDSASAPVSSGAIVPVCQDHEARTWAKEAMAEMLREAGDKGG